MKLRIGDKAPDFCLEGVGDEEVRLTDLAGSPAVAVIFSCNHCPYVQAWEERMVEIQRDFGPEGVKLVAVNSNDEAAYPEDSLEKMAERAARRRFNFPYLRDPTQEVARTFGAERTPEVFVFDSNLTLAYHGAIDDNYEDPAAVRHHYLRSALAAVVKGLKPNPDQTSPVGCTVKWIR